MTSTPAAPRVSRRPSLPLIWVVPLLALAIAGWMIARQLGDRGPEITIHFANGAGIERGQTEIEYKGVSVGKVTDVALREDLGAVVVRARLTKAAAGIARAGSEFWIVQPEVSLSGVRGLDTLLNGPRIKVRPGQGDPASEFRGLDRSPPLEDPGAGRAFVLRTDKLGGLTPGAPVYYRGVKVGSVETTLLANDATAALIRIRVYTPYVDLVRTNTEFWNAGGVSFKLGITGAEVRANTLQSILAGGVAFASPPQDPLAPTALEGTEFRLHADPQKEWLEWSPRIPIDPVESTPESAAPEAAVEPPRVIPAAQP